MTTYNEFEFDRIVGNYKKKWNITDKSHMLGSTDIEILEINNDEDNCVYNFKFRNSWYKDEYPCLIAYRGSADEFNGIYAAVELGYADFDNGDSYVHSDKYLECSPEHLIEEIRKKVLEKTIEINRLKVQKTFDICNLVGDIGKFDKLSDSKYVRKEVDFEYELMLLDYDVNVNVVQFKVNDLRKKVEYVLRNNVQRNDYELVRKSLKGFVDSLKFFKIQIID